jgi:hypothetical protein
MGIYSWVSKKFIERSMRKNLKEYSKIAIKNARARESLRVPIEGLAKKIAEKVIYIAKSPLAEDDRQEYEKNPNNVTNMNIGDFKGWYGKSNDGDDLSIFSYFFKGYYRSDEGLEPFDDPYGIATVNYQGRVVFNCCLKNDHVYTFEKGEWEDRLDSLYIKAKDLTENSK